MLNSAPSRLFTFLLIVICIALSPNLWAQKDAGSIVGTVTDPSGAVVVKAKVIVAGCGL